MKTKYILLGFMATWCFCACGTVLNKERASFRLDSIPVGAKITTHSGALLGFTPIVLKLPKTASSRSEKVLYVSALGYKTAKVKITPEFNKQTLFNLSFISTSLGLPSFTVDQANGMIYKYQADSYVVEMMKIPVVKDRGGREKVIEKTEGAEATLKANAEAAQKERKLAEQQAKLEAEQQAKLEAEQQAKLEAETRLADEKRRLADEKEKLAAEKAEIERLKLEAERIKIEQERKKLEREKKRLQKSLQEANDTDESEESSSNSDRSSPPIDSPEESLRSKEEKLLESMKQRYQNELKRRQNNRPKRDSRIPEIEVDPLSSLTNSPSYGALALSVAQHQALLKDFALGEGLSSQELFLRLCLALDQSLDSQHLVKLYPDFMREAQSNMKVLGAPHGLALFRAIKPIHEGLITLK